MLTTLRIVLPPGGPRDLGVGKAEVGAGPGGGIAEDGARKPLFGVDGGLPVAVERAPVLFLVFTTGRAGRAVLGGPLEGREGLGIVLVAIMTRRLNEIAPCEDQHCFVVGMFPAL